MKLHLQGTHTISFITFKIHVNKKTQRKIRENRLAELRDALANDSKIPYTGIYWRPIKFVELANK